MVFEKKMEVFHTMEDGLTRPNVYINMKLPPTTVSKMKRNADEIEPSMQHVTKVSAAKVRHSFFGKFCKKKWRNYCHYEWKN